MSRTVVTYQLAYQASGLVDVCADCADRGDHELGSLGPVSHGAHRGECQSATHPRSGRPPRDREPGRPLTLRVPDDQRATWEDAAGRLSLPIAEWIREACDLAVARGSTR